MPRKAQGFNISLRKFRVLCVLCVLISFSVHEVRAEDQPVTKLEEVLKWTYENNPTLQAARAELKAVQEEMPQALSGWKPSADASGNVTDAEIDGGVGNGTTSKSAAFEVTQPLYRGGRTLAATRVAEDTILAQRALLKALEQQVLFTAASAYMDVLRDKALLELSVNNENVLTKELEATAERFEVGEITRTDVSQAEARLARAASDRIRSSGNLQSSIAAYEEVVGIRPGALENPAIKFPVPETLDETVIFAENNNPTVIAAGYIHESAENSVDEIFGELLPELFLSGSWDRQYDPQPGILEETTTRSILVSATIPLYEAGGVRSRVRQAKHTANQRFIEILESRRDIREQAISSWEDLQAAKAETKSREAQVDASRLALEGVRAESDIGSRTVLDVLDAEQEYLDAQVALVTARRNVVVAEFSLASTLGILIPEVLGLHDFSGEFDEHLDSIKWKILGTDVDINPMEP